MNSDNVTIPIMWGLVRAVRNDRINAGIHGLFPASVETPKIIIQLGIPMLDGSSSLRISSRGNSAGSMGGSLGAGGMGVVGSVVTPIPEGVEGEAFLVRRDLVRPSAVSGTVSTSIVSSKSPSTSSSDILYPGVLLVI
jgi:hypothetical protein